MKSWSWLNVRASQLRDKSSTFWHLPQREKAWFFLLIPLSGAVRLVLCVMPFNWYARHLGEHHKNYQLSPLVSSSELERARGIGRTIALVSRYTPWQSKCLVQAVMARIMLGYYGIPYIMHLGTKLTRESSSSMKGHAWVKVGARIIVGREGHKTYTIVGSFVASSLLAK